MQKNADITFRDNKFFISGDLTFSNVMSVYEKSLLLFKTSQAITCDFSQLNSSDSAGLALMIEWLKHAEQCGKPIQFDSIPPELLSIATAAGLDTLITSSSS